MEVEKLKGAYTSCRDNFARMLVNITSSKLELSDVKQSLDSGLEVAIAGLANRDKKLAEVLFIIASDKGIQHPISQKESIELSRFNMPNDIMDRILPEASNNVHTAATQKYLLDLIASSEGTPLRIVAKDGQKENDIKHLSAAFMEYFAYKTNLLTHHGEKFDGNKFYAEFVKLDRDVATKVHGQLGGTEETQKVIIGAHTEQLIKANEQLEFALRQRLLS
jgi:hypothetical protein